MYRYVNLGNWCVITRNNILVLDSELGQKNSFSEEEVIILCGELNDLEMIKAFARLEGVELSADVNDLTGSYETISAPYMPYNPLENMELAFKAALDYRMEVNFDKCYVSSPNYPSHTITFSRDEDAQRAIIECILKSKGKWI